MMTRPPLEWDFIMIARIWKPTISVNCLLMNATNAKAMENAGAGIVLEEKILNETVLYDKIKDVIYDAKLLASMGDNAAKLYKPNVETKIYEEIKSLLK